VQGRNKRLVTVVVACVLLAGIVIGAAMALDAPTRTRAAQPRVVSYWRNGSHLTMGSLRTDPRRGFVHLVSGGKSVVFTTPEGVGALRLSASIGNGWKLRSSSGDLALLHPAFDSDFARTPASFEFLGRRLNPAKLGRIGSRGVAGAIEWWEGKKLRHHHSVVVLVEQTPGRQGSFGNGWKVDGYLPGFSTLRRAAWLNTHVRGNVRGTTQELRQPLFGPDGQSYSIDVKRGRVVRIGKGPVERFEGYKLGGCTNWPGSNGASYRACGGSITVHHAQGAGTTVFRRPGDPNTAPFFNAWTFLQPSPNGRWLLLEETAEACSTYSWVEFMPAHGGRLASIFPGSPVSSSALGWLPDNTALVEGAPQACGGSGAEGIYQVRPGTGSHPAYQLVFPDLGDATTWGYSGSGSR
jgi:hypothetical protein